MLVSREFLFLSVCSISLCRRLCFSRIFVFSLAFCVLVIDLQESFCDINQQWKVNCPCLRPSILFSSPAVFSVWWRTQTDVIYQSIATRCTRDCVLQAPLCSPPWAPHCFRKPITGTEISRARPGLFLLRILELMVITLLIIRCNSHTYVMGAIK